MAYAESGFYKPAVFNNYADGVEFLRHLICKELNIEMFENVGCLPNARMYSVDPQTIQVSLSTYNPRIRHYMNNEGYKELTKRIEEKAYFLKRVDEENVENYRNTYKTQVRQHLTSDTQ